MTGTERPSAVAISTPSLSAPRLDPLIFDQVPMRDKFEACKSRIGTFNNLPLSQDDLEERAGTSHGAIGHLPSPFPRPMTLMIPHASA